MAFKYARATEHRLIQVSETHQIVKGYLHLKPDATVEDWQDSKKRFALNLRRFRQKTKWQIEFIAKQHVSIQDNPDRIHYDLIGYHAIPRSERWVRDKSLELWHKSGGFSGGLGPIGDNQILLTAVNYCFKYPLATAQRRKYDRTFPLPIHSKPSVIWQTSQFWGRKPREEVFKYYWDGEYQEKIKVASPLNQHWREWVIEQMGEKPPYFTTQENTDETEFQQLGNRLFYTPEPPD